jgi:toxin YoeB
MRLIWSDEAWEDYLYWQSQEGNKLRRVNELIKDIRRNGYKGVGKLEPLKGDLSGWWSRRIDEVNRIVYRVRDGHIEIAQCRAHYGDK